MTKTTLAIFALGTLTFGAGCAVEIGSDEDVGEGEASLVSEQVDSDSISISINGNHPGGSIKLMGGKGPQVTGRSDQQEQLQGLTLWGSALTSARVSDGAVLTGAALVGASFSASTPEGVPLSLTILAMDTQTTTYSDDAIFRYAISYRSGSGSSGFVCGLDADGHPVRAIPLEGAWSEKLGVPGGGSKDSTPGLISFACEGHALAQCVHLGYEPWAKVNGGTLDRHHQACVRMLRADYCGDGTSYTALGAPLSFYDHVGAATDSANWVVESEWNEDGARCVVHQRLQGAGKPSCPFKLDAPSCANPVNWRETLLVSEVMP